MELSKEMQEANERQRKQLEQCTLCYIRYSNGGQGYDTNCETYSGLASFGITRSDEHGVEICNNLEILLKDIKKVKSGDPHTTYTECAQRIVSEGL